MEQNNVINPRLYADLSNSSTIPFSTQLQGDIIWKDTTVLKANPQPAEHLCIIDDALIVYYNDQDATINVRLKETGESKWTKAHSFKNQFQIIEKQIISMPNYGQLEFIDLDQITKKVIDVPLFVASYVRYFESEKQVGHFCMSHFHPDTGPEFTYVCNDFDEDEIIWMYEKPDALVTVLKYLPENRLYLVASSNIYTFTLDSRDDKKIKTITCDIVKFASLDPDGNLILAEETKDGLSLKCLNSEEKDPLWQYDMRPSTVISQPPSAISTDYTYMLQNNNLLKLKQSTVEWEVSLPSEPEKIRFTVLSDESILVSANQSLLHISPDGKVINKMIFPDQLTCRPIVDSEGKIYVAGSNIIFCIK